MPRKGSKVNQLDDDDEIGDQPVLPRASIGPRLPEHRAVSAMGHGASRGLHLIWRHAYPSALAVGGVGSIQ
jgi:hypothetical protein